MRHCIPECMEIMMLQMLLKWFHLESRHLQRILMLTRLVENLDAYSIYHEFSLHIGKAIFKEDAIQLCL
jgi:hypothetical protein